MIIIHNHYPKNLNIIYFTLIKQEFSQICIRYSIRQVINNLPNIESELYINSLKSFPSHVKTFTMNDYESSCDIYKLLHLLKIIIYLRPPSYAMPHILGKKYIVYFALQCRPEYCFGVFILVRHECMYKYVDLSVLLSV